MDLGRFNCISFVSRVRGSFSELPNQSGLSRSGLCIRGAISILESVAYIKTPSIVINVGSIDIMQGRDLIDMQTDYKELVNVCIKRNVQPIITTLAPLANTSHYYSRDMRDKLILFNNFLINCYYLHYQVINLWSQLVTPRGRTLFEYFEPYVGVFTIHTRLWYFGIRLQLT